MFQKEQFWKDGSADTIYELDDARKSNVSLFEEEHIRAKYPPNAVGRADKLVTSN